MIQNKFHFEIRNKCYHNKYQYIHTGSSEDDRFVLKQIAAKIIQTYQHSVSIYLTE